MHAEQYAGTPVLDDECLIFTGGTAGAVNDTNCAIAMTGLLMLIDVRAAVWSQPVDMSTPSVAGRNAYRARAQRKMARRKRLDNVDPDDGRTAN